MNERQSRVSMPKHHLTSGQRRSGTTHLGHIEPSGEPKNWAYVGSVIDPARIASRLHAAGRCVEGEKSILVQLDGKAAVSSRLGSVVAREGRAQLKGQLNVQRVGRRAFGSPVFDVLHARYAQ